MPIAADMLALPFADGRFDKTLSVTALEFIEDARRAVDELFRVTRPWGLVVVATLNSLSPWAVRRRGVARTDKRNIFHNAHFRSPRQLAELAPIGGTVKTAIHFDRDEHPSRAAVVEREGRLAASDKGAFLAACWQKP